MDELESLEAKIEERKNEARKKNIVNKCYAVTEFLGERLSKPKSPEHAAEVQAYSNLSVQSYSEGDLCIERARQWTFSFSYEGWYSDISLKVYHKEKIVFEEKKDSGHRNNPGKSHINLYIPGPWEKIIEIEYLTAEKKRVQIEKEEREEKVRNAKEKRQLEEKRAARELERKRQEDKKKAEELRRKWAL